MKRRRGFASLMVIVIVPVVGIAMLAIALLVAADVRRTTSVVQDAQLRQLLLAGGMATLDRSGAWNETPAAASFKVDLPATFTEKSAAVHVDTVPQRNAVTARVTAQFAGGEIAQVIRLERDGSRWKIASAALESSR